ncbi:MAG: MarR family transcriptional regulator [Aigarchaeota archaeon]|nr:MarR family transcriptional regulator [Candidatus Calditenuaceae archaeon]
MLWLVALVLASTLPSYTIYHLSVLPDGSTAWMIEHRFPLVSPEDAEEFNTAAAQLDNLTSDYRSRIEAIVSDASRVLGRPMSVEGFRLESKTVETVSGRMGLIRIEFTWRGFARTEATGEIRLGDVFIGGFYLSEGETLRIAVPPGFEVVEASPSPDGRGVDYLEWRGRIVFPDSEPRLSLRRAEPSEPGLLQQGYSPESVMLFAAGGAAASLTAAYFVRRLRGKKPARRSELDMVLGIIRRHGGVVYQSQIVRESGLSKSTVSTILKVLESEGRVVKIKEGRENLVKLTR